MYSPYFIKGTADTDRAPCRPSLNSKGVGILTSVEFHRGSPGKLDSRTVNRKTLNRWPARPSHEAAWRRAPTAGPSPGRSSSRCTR